MPTILHIGAPKCGSSALQAALCRNPVLKKAGSEFRYAAINMDGATVRLLIGEQLAPSPADRCAPALSTIAHRFDRISSRAASQITAELKALDARGISIILSAESWLNNPQALRRHILPMLPDRPRCILYIRPQLEALNAAWWQWGAWSGNSFHGFIDNQARAVAWYEQLQKFIELTGLQPEIRILPKDIVSDFTKLIGMPRLNGESVNRSLPGPVLRLMQRNAHLMRPNPHDARMDFLLDHLKLSDAPTPWVIGPRHAQQLLDQFKSGNDALCAQLPPEQAAMMREDNRWWEVAAFEERGWQTPEACAIDADEVEQLAIALCQALMRSGGTPQHRKTLRDYWRVLSSRFSDLKIPRSVMIKSKG